MEEALGYRTGRAEESFQLPGEPLSITAPAEAASNFIAETAQFVQHYLLGAMAVAFGGGMLVGWLIAHDLKIRLYAGSEQRQQKASEDKADKRAISRWEGEGGALLSIKKSGDK
jgi:uncharacterized membrane protein YciS (DUF1049 family)